jgi:prophage antirepressor-like protein
MEDIVRFTNIDSGVTLDVLKDDSGEIWFPGKEVAEALGYKNTADAVSRHVHREDKRTISGITDGIEILDNGGDGDGEKTLKQGVRVSRTPLRGVLFGNIQPNKIYISEPGFYDLVSGSQLDSARTFRRWVHKEVLPSIRKTGGYTLTPQKPPEDLVNLTRWIKETFPGTMISVTPHFTVDTREKLEICKSIGWEIGQPEITIHCPSGSNTGLVVFCTSNENTEKWVEYHEKCSSKVLRVCQGGMDRVMRDIRNYFQKVIRKCDDCSRRFRDCRTIINHMAKEQKGWGHEEELGLVLDNFDHCGRCKVCEDALNKNKCFICINHYNSYGNGAWVYGDEDYTFQTRGEMIKHIQIMHGIETDTIQRCMKEISTPKTKVVL